MDRDNFMDSLEAKKFNLIDEILKPAPKNMLNEDD